MNFKYDDETENLSIKTDNHVDIEFYIEDGEVTEFYIDGEENDPTRDCWSDIYVRIGGEMISLYNLCLQAERFHNSDKPRE